MSINNVYITCRVQYAAGLNADLQCLLSYGASWLLVF